MKHDNIKMNAFFLTANIDVFSLKRMLFATCAISRQSQFKRDD